MYILFTFIIWDEDDRCNDCNDEDNWDCWDNGGEFIIEDLSVDVIGREDLFIDDWVLDCSLSCIIYKELFFLIVRRITFFLLKNSDIFLVPVYRIILLYKRNHYQMKKHY